VTPAGLGPGAPFGKSVEALVIYNMSVSSSEISRVSKVVLALAGSERFEE